MSADFGDELLDGFSAQQLFHVEDADGLTFDDIIALVRVVTKQLFIRCSCLRH